MRVLINLLVAAGKKTGIGHYVTQLVRCLRELEDLDYLEEFPPAWFRSLWSAGTRLRPYLMRGRPATTTSAAPAPLLKTRLLGWLRSGSQTLIAGQLRRRCRWGRFDLYHEPNYIPLPCDVPIVTTVHDLSLLLHPQWHPADRVRHFEKHFHEALPRSAHFLAISEFGRQEIIRICGIAPERVSRTWMGVRPDLKPLPPEQVAARLRQLGLPPRYLLYLGTLEPRKNLLTLLRAYCSLDVSLRENWPLVLVGSWGWQSDDLRTYLDSLARQRGVLHLGYLPDEAVPLIYNGARALVFPSFYEGFGLPPVEMMACGGAVLASTAGAVVETVGTKAHLIPAEDVDGWRTALQRVLTDDDWWQSLRQGTTEVARRFTWEKCARDTWTAYRRALGVSVQSAA